MRKRGLSPVVATVLLLLLTISAIVIIATVILPFIRGGLDSGTECLAYRDYFSIEEKIGDTGFNCYDKLGSPSVPLGYDDNFFHGVSIRAGLDVDGISDEVIGFNLLFIQKEGGKSKTVEVKENDAESCTAGDGVRLLSSACDSLTTLKIPGPGEVRTYVFNGGVDQYDTVEVYPILKSDRICDKSGEISYVGCFNFNLGG